MFDSKKVNELKWSLNMKNQIIKKLEEELVEIRKKYYELLPAVPRKEFLKVLPIGRLLEIAKELHIFVNDGYNKADIITDILETEEEIKSI